MNRIFDILVYSMFTNVEQWYGEDHILQVLEATINFIMLRDHHRLPEEKQQMFWINKHHRFCFFTFENLTQEPSGDGLHIVLEGRGLNIQRGEENERVY